MAGRPSAMTQDVRNKLELAFAIGASDEEACGFAGVSLAALYHYQRRHPEYRERKRLLKLKPVLTARRSLVKGVETDAALALKFLERVKKDEFSTRREVDVQGQVRAIFRWDGEDVAKLVSGREATDVELIEQQGAELCVPHVLARAGEVMDAEVSARNVERSSVVQSGTGVGGGRHDPVGTLCDPPHPKLVKNSDTSIPKAKPSKIPPVVNFNFFKSMEG